MNKLVQIFEKLKHTQVLDIATEFFFFTDTELKKSEYDRQLAAFLEREEYADEVIARYDVNPGLETTKPEQAISLFAFQCSHKDAMIEGFDRNTTFINASEPGTGKTFVTLSYAETGKTPLMVVCPKSVFLTWYLLALKNEVEILTICNYETFINGKMYAFSSKLSMSDDNMPRVDNPYLKRIEGRSRGKKTVTFEWKNLPEKTLIVFDEAHFCKNLGTQRTELLMSAYAYARHPENRWRNIKILLLSATIIETKANLAPFMYVLGYAKSPRDKTNLDRPDFSVRNFGYELLSGRRMTRCSMKEAREGLQDFKKSDVRTKMFKVDEENQKRIQAACEEIRNVFIKSEGKKSKNHLAVRLKKRQEIEAIKIGIIAGEIKRLRAEGYSMLAFVNFQDSHSALLSLLRKEMPSEKVSVIIGGQEASVRLAEVDKFQSGETKIAVVMIGAGGTGIGMHDTKGGLPKYALLSPPESATQLIQALGRVDRIGAKTDSIQRIIFVAGTIEEQIAENLSKKMRMMGDLNGDEDSASDNLFMYDVVHDYKEEDKEKFEPQQGSIKVAIEAKTMIIEVPDYMVDAFENGLPQAAIPSMQIKGSKYHFDIKHRAILQEFLENLAK